MKDASQKLLEAKQEQEQLYEYLKDNSDYYPEVLIHERGNLTYYSTFIRVFRDGQWIIVHYVEKFDKDGSIDQPTFCMHFGWGIYQIQHLYQPNGEWQEVDKLQIAESERLTRLSEIYHEKEEEKRQRTIIKDPCGK